MFILQETKSDLAYTPALKCFWHNFLNNGLIFNLIGPLESSQSTLFNPGV